MNDDYYSTFLNFAKKGFLLVLQEQESLWFQSVTVVLLFLFSFTEKRKKEIERERVSVNFVCVTLCDCNKYGLFIFIIYYLLYF